MEARKWAAGIVVAYSRVHIISIFLSDTTARACRRQRRRHSAAIRLWPPRTAQTVGGWCVPTVHPCPQTVWHGTQWLYAKDETIFEHCECSGQQTAHTFFVFVPFGTGTKSDGDCAEARKMD